MVSLNVPGVGPEIERRVSDIDAETLTPIVRAILDDDTATIDEWDRSPMRGGVGGGYFGTALFRFEGTATVASSATERWSVVLKILAKRPDEVPSGHPYWKREAEAYRSDHIQQASGGLVPATTYRIDEYPGESVWLWLEDLSDDDGGSESWSLDQYRQVARHLGQFNGAFLTGSEFPSGSWVIERTFDFSRTAGVVALVDTLPDEPIVRRHFPTEESRNRLFSAWQQRDQLLAARDDLPPTFCHFDAFGRNLFATTTDDGTPRTVAIDWDQCGIARLGDDAGALVFLTLVFLDWPVSRARELERAVLDGYREGLTAVGWSGPDELVSRGYRLHVATRWLEWVGIAVKLTADEGNYEWIAEMVGNPIEDVLDGNRDLHRFAFDTLDKLDLSASPPGDATDESSVGEA
ncbi:phosphotransferase [Haloferax sp. S1W]|uniref:phosphotransferase n=1 Tax=Haloferax sp. S1W TaxID=3377110 RepID=UPI0037CBFF7F